MITINEDGVQALDDTECYRVEQAVKAAASDGYEITLTRVWRGPDWQSAETFTIDGDPAGLLLAMVYLAVDDGELAVDLARARAVRQLASGERWYFPMISFGEPDNSPDPDVDPYDYLYD